MRAGRRFVYVFQFDGPKFYVGDAEAIPEKYHECVKRGQLPPLSTDDGVRIPSAIRRWVEEGRECEDIIVLDVGSSLAAGVHTFWTF